jgi:hypothetical protein
MCALGAAVSVAMMRTEVRLGIEYLVAIRAWVLELLLMIPLLVNLPVVLSSKALVARCAEIPLLHLQLILSLPSVGFDDWDRAASCSFIQGTHHSSVTF